MNPLRDGWIIKAEPPPSLNRHFFPTGHGHQLWIGCWCKPTLEGHVTDAPVGTVVIHKQLET